MIRIKLIFSSLASFLLLLANISVAKTTSNIYNESKSSIVLLIVFDSNNIPLSLGSGFFFDEKHIVTNYHVIDGASRIIYQFIDSNKTYEVLSISGYSQNLDLALLEVGNENIPLKISKELNVEIGEKVIAIGNPKGLTGSVSEGIISGVRKHDSYVFLQITAPISPGSSGGPLFNEDGEVIGVTTMTLRDTQNINFAISSHIIYELKKKGKNWEPTFPDNVFDQKIVNSGIEIIEPRFTNLYGGKFSWSISNKTSNTIRNISYLLIFRNVHTGNVLHYESFNDNRIFPPGLSTRNTKWIEQLEMYQVEGENIYPHSNRDIYGYVLVELRVFSYDIIE